MRGKSTPIGQETETAAGSLNAQTRRHVFRGFDSSIERLLGADMRLIYGMAAPILMIIGLIVVLGLSPAPWLVAAILVIEIGGLGVVVAGLLEMLNDEDEDEPGAA